MFCTISICRFSPSHKPHPASWEHHCRCKPALQVPGGGAQYTATDVPLCCCLCARICLSFSFLNDDARKCHPGLAGLTDMDTVEFNTVGDLVMAYSPDTVPSFTFNIAPAPPSGFSSLVTAFFNGRAGPAGTRTDGLPLTRFVPSYSPLMS
jgi:hypothetical protein